MTNEEYNTEQETDFETIEVGETGSKKVAKVIISLFFLILIALITVGLVYSFIAEFNKPKFNNKAEGYTYYLSKAPIPSEAEIEQWVVYYTEYMSIDPEAINSFCTIFNEWFGSLDFEKPDINIDVCVDNLFNELEKENFLDADGVIKTLFFDNMGKEHIKDMVARDTEKTELYMMTKSFEKQMLENPANLFRDQAIMSLKIKKIVIDKYGENAIAPTELDLKVANERCSVQNVSDAAVMQWATDEKAKAKFSDLIADNYNWAGK